MTAASDSDNPENALPLGTLIRSKRFDRLGAVTDSFYGDKDLDGTKIIIYTVLLFPLSGLTRNTPEASREDYYVSNEYEYDIIAYLMMEPINLNKLVKTLGGGFLL